MILTPISKPQKMETELSLELKFIAKLNNIIDANLENEQFGVSKLSEEIGMSRSQLHRKLYSINGTSVSRFIREYRLKKAMEMLQKDVATASEIAYRVGFNSPTYFTTCFSEHYGYPPGEAKLRNPLANMENDRDQSSKLTEASKTTEEYKPKSKNIISKRMIIANSLGIILLSIFFYFFYQNSKDENLLDENEIIINDKSIAVLPFESLSNEEEIQFFAVGVSAIIRNHLSHIKELEVISGITMKQYRETAKTVPEIAKELDVSYILNGIVQKDENKVRIVVTLIDARNDKEISSNNFESEFKNVLTLENVIAKEVAAKLKATISKEELEIIDKVPTKNMESFRLYTLGKHYWNKGEFGENKYLENSINYYEQSIENDPDFGLAYVGLADAYLALSGEFLPNKKEADKAKEYCLTAIELDSTIAEAHAILGFHALWINWDWKESEKRLKYALQLNPNSSIVRLYYSHYLQIQGDYNAARIQLNKALDLDPLSFRLHSCSADYFMSENKYEKALMENEKANELYDNRYSWKQFNYLTIAGKHDEAFLYLQDMQRVEGRDKKIIAAIEDIYQTSGIVGVNQSYIDYDLKNMNAFTPYHLAIRYAIIGENDKSLDWLEICYEERIPYMITINYIAFFKNLRSEPRFIALLKKMGLNN